MQLCFKLIYEIFVLIFDFEFWRACRLWFKPSTKSQRALAGDLSSASTERQLSKATKTIPRALFSQEEDCFEQYRCPKFQKSEVL